jgi:ribonuclease D
LEPAYEHLTVWDIKGVKGLDDKELPVMYELFKWRQERAARVNLPPFKVVNNKTLLDIAKARPKNKEELMAIKGITATVWHRNGQDMLNAVRRGDRLLASKVPLQSKTRRNDARQPVHWNDQHAVDSLKKWRSAKAEERGIHHLAVLPGYALENIARLRPHGSEALSAIQGVGKKRAELYGDEILDIIMSLKH